MKPLFRKLYRMPEVRLMTAICAVSAGVYVGAAWPTEIADIIALSAVFR